MQTKAAQSLMLIKRIHTKNFRCILDEELDCEPLTALVGPNGCGKSTFIRALELFYASAPRVTADDFYNRDTSQAIEVSVTFGELGHEAIERFAPYIDGNLLTVTRVISLENGEFVTTLHGRRRLDPAFAPFRTALANVGKNAARLAYGEIRASGRFEGLPAVASSDAALAVIEEWEARHPESCSWQRDQGQFFGFKQVGQGYLGDFTRLIVIPAVRDAAEESAEGKGSPITALMDLVVRSGLAESDELKRFTEEANARYEEVMAGKATMDRLASIEKALGTTLTTYVPTAGVRIEWLTEGGVKLSLPQAGVKLLEDSYASPVDRTGHGLQRAFILAMLQHLASVRTTIAPPSAEGGGAAIPEPARPDLKTGETASGTVPNLVIAIEEPELYQHPSRQRHLAKVLLKLSKEPIPGVASASQVLYATHSPLFVGIDRFSQIRLMRKVPNGGGKPPVARVTRTDLNSVAAELWESCGRKDRNGRDIERFTGETLSPRLQCLMTPWMSEAFFADVVVLVEGEGDRAAILGAALAQDRDFESMGIAVIPCGGKASMDRPALIFRRLKIPTYLVWDGDYGVPEGIRSNLILQRIVGVEPVEYPSGICASYAALRTKLETMLAEELDPVYGPELDRCRAEFGYAKRTQAEKNPRVMGEVIRRSGLKGARSQSLEAITGCVAALLGT